MDKTLKLVLLAGLVWAAVALDMGVISYSLKAIGEEFALTAGQLGVLASSTLVGMLIGAYTSGLLGDRYGRTSMATGYALLHSAATVLGALAPSYELVVADRVLVGIGLGGVLPLVSSLVAELSRPERRGRNIAFLESFWAWGWLAAVLVSWAVQPGMGWRAYMAAAGALSALLNTAILVLPESPRYLVSAGRRGEAERIVEEYGVPLPRIAERRLGLGEQLELLLGGGMWRITVPLWVTWFIITMGYYGIFIWFPKLVAQKGAELGLGAVQSFIKKNFYPYLVLVTLFQLPGYYSAVFLVDRVGRKPVLAGYLAGVAVSAYFYSTTSSLAGFLAWGAVLNFFDLGAWAALYVYTPEQYPTQVRATGSGWAASWGRVGGIIGPYLVPQLGGWQRVFGFFAAIHLVGAAAAAVGREMKGREMPEIEE